MPRPPAPALILDPSERSPCPQLTIARSALRSRARRATRPRPRADRPRSCATAHQRRLAGLAARARPHRPAPLQPPQPAADRPPGPRRHPRRRVPRVARARLLRPQGRDAAASASGRAASRPSASCRPGATPAPTRPRSPKAFYRLEAVFDRAQVDPLPPPAVPAPLDRRSRRSPATPSPGRSPCWTAFADGLGVTVEREPMRDGLRRLLRPAHAADRDQPRGRGQPAGRGAGARARARARPPRPPGRGPGADLRRGGAGGRVGRAAPCAGSSAWTPAGNSIPYLAVWSEHTPDDAFERIAGLVDRLARRLEDALEPAPGRRAATATAAGERRGVTAAAAGARGGLARAGLVEGRGLGLRGMLPRRVQSATPPAP